VGQTGGQHGQRLRPVASGGQVAGVGFHCVVQQRGADDLRIADAVMADDPQRDAQQVVDIRFALAPVQSVQAPGEFQSSANFLPAGRIIKARSLDGEPRPQPLLAVNSADGMQGHHSEDLLSLIWNAARHAGFLLPPVSPRRTGPKLAEILVAQQPTPATRTANSGASWRPQ
jgi:hypothetical protein